MRVLEGKDKDFREGVLKILLEFKGWFEEMQPHFLQCFPMEFEVKKTGLRKENADFLAAMYPGKFEAEKTSFICRTVDEVLEVLDLEMEQEHNAADVKRAVDAVFANKNGEWEKAVKKLKTAVPAASELELEKLD